MLAKTLDPTLGMEDQLTGRILAHRSLKHLQSFEGQVVFMQPPFLHLAVRVQ